MKVKNSSHALLALAILSFLALACSSADFDGSSAPGGRGPKSKASPVPAESPGEGDSESRVPNRDARILSGRVVGVTDGDTLVIFNSSERTRTRVRLATIDCPEKTQDFGVKAKESLSSMAFGKDAEVEVRSIDRYGRTVGVVRIGGMDVNLEQVKRGFAWHYTQYSREQPADERRSYAEAERRAREGRIGLWVDSNPIAPWNYRRAKRNQGSFAE